MAGRKYGIDTDEFDKEAREAAEDIVKQQIAKEWSYEELQNKYENLKAVTLKNLPNLWRGLEFALSVKTVLNIKGNTLPFIGILLGPASSMKTLIIELFREYDLTLYADSFSPKSMVSHNSGVSEEELRNIDLLPKMRNRLFLTPELSPLFAARDDDLLLVLSILTRIADGNGYESFSGAKGHRGYAGEMMFTWLGAAVDIPYKVHKLFGNLGPKLYFLRLPRNEESEDDYHSKRKDDFKLKKKAVCNALFEYLQYFDLNPSIIIEQEDEVTRTIWRNGNGNGNGNNGNEKGKGKKKDKQQHKPAAEEPDLLPPKIEMFEDFDDENADRIIIRLCMMLARLRAIVPTWETYGSEGSEYAFAMPRIEDPSRAITQMRNLARGHALSQGRLSFAMEDIAFIIQVVMSTGSTERVRIFELLLAYNGILTTSQICESLEISRNTALKTMLELKVAGLVDLHHEDQYNATKRITLKTKFEWFLSDEFRSLKDAWSSSRWGEGEGTCNKKYPPHTDEAEAEAEADKTQSQSSNNGQNTRHETKENDDVRGGEILLQPPDGDNDGSYSCPYCDSKFDSEDLYVKHVVKRHVGWTAYPGPPDLEKYRRLQNDKKSKLADMAEANQSGNGVMRGYGGSGNGSTRPSSGLWLWDA